MQALDLVTDGPRSFLTKTEAQPKDGNSTPDTYPCDIQGNRVSIENALPIYRDRYTAKTFVRVSETMPSGSSAMDALGASIKALNPTHFVSPDGSVKGFFVEAPDFNGREGK